MTEESSETAAAAAAAVHVEPATAAGRASTLVDHSQAELQPLVMQ